MTIDEDRMFSEERIEEIDRIAGRYPDPRSALLPILHEIQEKEGWISPDSMEWVARRLDLSPAHVEGVVSFYSMFFTSPKGRRVIQLCRTLSCDLRGAREIRKMIGEKLGIAVGETTEDGEFSLVEVECIGACGTAPAMMIGDALYENLTPAGLDAILDEAED